ncbi:glycosyltransferase family 2 protein [Sagittula sp. SSi028]|uniref:glycosyltransferase family 2 protein n=1 Tax=Sagittula sp. SSi028 TaxID=3400636 RepID=UPI003AF9434F
MAVAALTMVYRDTWALSRWYAHHARQFGARNLFVVAHGEDPEIARICPEASIITIPRDDLAHFDRRRAQMLDGFHAGLSKAYDWVVRTDADELICVDPALWRDVPQALAAQDGPVVTALGFDVVELPGDAPMHDAPVLSQRRNIAFSGHYSKAVAANRAVAFHLHGVRVAPRKLENYPFNMPRGLFLAHLKYANRAVLQAGSAQREAIANGSAPGLPGSGWADATGDAARFLTDFEAKPEVTWQKAERRAYEALSQNPSRNAKASVVKTHALKMKMRCLLPDRFAEQG